MLITLPAENYFANSHLYVEASITVIGVKILVVFNSVHFPYIKTRVKLKNILIITKLIYYAHIM